MDYFRMISFFHMALLGAVYSHPTTSSHTCSLCPPGAKVKHVCTLNSDTICEHCDKGTFSDKSTDVTSCTQCLKCPQTMYEHRPCLNNSDTVCTPCSRAPAIRSKHYIISCESAETDITSIDLSDVMLADDPGDADDPLNEMGKQKSDNVGDTAENDGTDEKGTSAVEEVESVNKDHRNGPILTYDVANEERKEIHPPTTDTPADTSLLKPSSDIPLLNDAADDDDKQRLVTAASISESKLQVPESKVSDQEGNKIEQTVSPESEVSNIKHLKEENNREVTGSDQNSDGNTPTDVPAEEAVEPLEEAAGEDTVNNETTTEPLELDERLRELDDNSEKDRTTLPTLEEGRFEAVKLDSGMGGSVAEKGEENSSLIYTEDISTLTSVNDDVSYLTDDHVNNRDLDVAADSQSTTEDVRTLEAISTEPLNNLTDLESDEPTKSGIPGDIDLKDVQQEPEAEKAQHKNITDDPKSKKRAAIIIGVAIGGLVVFTLVVVAARCYSRRRGRFKEMKKVKKVDDESAELRPLNQSENDNHEEPIVRTTNGLYRQGPKTGPSSPRRQQTEQEKAEPGVNGDTEYTIQIPQLTVSPASDVEDLPESPPLNDVRKGYAPVRPNTPSLQRPTVGIYSRSRIAYSTVLLTTFSNISSHSVEKMKYIDDSTDDEYVNYFLSRHPKSRSPNEYNLSNVMEETPPTSPSFRQ